MKAQLQVIVDVIIHATEDAPKFLDAFSDMFKLEKNDFTSLDTAGHYGNPITMLGITLKKEKAWNFLGTLLGEMDMRQKDSILDEIEERTSGSVLYLRIDKQEFLAGKIMLAASGSIKVRIRVPIYNKKHTVETFDKVLRQCSGQLN